MRSVTRAFDWQWLSFTDVCRCLLVLRLSLLTRVYGRTAGNSMNGDTIKHRTREEVLGVERTVVVTYEQKLYHRNLKTFGFVGHK